MVTREDVLAQRDEWLARKDELQARFVDKVDDSVVDSAIGLSLMGAGLGTIVMNIVQGKRSIWGYLIGAAFMMLGAAVLGGGAYSRRSGKISEAEEQVRMQLAGLDPIARAQILKDMAGETVAPFMRRSAAESN
jgi:hypothetical protein